MLRVIGLMSGTSLDGVDAAWLETDGRSVRRFGNALTLPYDEALRSDLRGILDVADGLSPDDPLLLSVTERLTDRHAEAVAEIGAAADLIGFHGQTILHRPNQGRTWQVGDAVRLARRTGLPVAHDFRSADVAAGGEGAPLAPVFHQALARDLDLPLAVLNIGGVANVTWVGAHGQLLAWDTGPGNGPLDDWVFRHTGAACDWNGAIAARGKADHEIVAGLLEAPYFARSPPKSLDRQDFAAVLASSGLYALPPEDGAATLVAFIAGGVTAPPPPGPPKRWLICGGGRRNPEIMRALGAALPAPVEPVEAVGWNGDALEAQCFAFLAARVSAGLPLTFPETTGAPAPILGGAIARP